MRAVIAGELVRTNWEIKQPSKQLGRQRSWLSEAAQNKKIKCAQTKKIKQQRPGQERVIPLE